MLQYNLSQPDRAPLHERISSSDISPKQLSTMSSTELANEEQQQEIKLAEKEALEHSILQKVEVPRAKITHKGLEDIEDMTGTITTQRDREREWEQEDEEKRERERMARLRAAQAQRQRSLSTSVPPQNAGIPDSPMTSMTPVTPSQGWGAPPALPLRALGRASSTTGDGVEPMVVQDESYTMEPDIDLADFINVDDEPTLNEDNNPKSPTTTGPGFSPITPAPDAAISFPSPVATTGPSPFTAAGSNPDLLRERSASFDLNSLWTASKQEQEDDEPREDDVHEGDEEDMQIDGDDETDDSADQDFDMLFKETEVVDNSPEAQQTRFENLGSVWSGTASVSFNIFMNTYSDFLHRSVCPSTPLSQKRQKSMPVK